MKYQILTLIFHMPKPSWTMLKIPQIIMYIKFITESENFENALKSESTKADCSITYQSKLTAKIPDLECPFGSAVTNTKWLKRDFLIIKHHLSH